MLTQNEIRNRVTHYARSRGLQPSDFAKQATITLQKAGNQAEQISDEEARALLLHSTVENILPGLLRDFEEDNKNGKDGHDFWSFLGVLLLVLLVMAPQNRRMHTPEEEEAFLSAAARDEVAISAQLQADQLPKRDWSEFARLMSEDVNLPPLSDYAVSRESIYEDHP